VDARIARRIAAARDSSAVFLNILPDRIFETIAPATRKGLHAQICRNIVSDEAEYPNSASDGMCRFEDATEDPAQVVSVDEENRRRRARRLHDLALQRLSVHAIVVRLPDGKEMRFDKLIDRAVAWWKTKFALRDL